MSESNTLVGMFVELAYREHIASLTQFNKTYAAKALQLAADNADSKSEWYCDTFNTMGSEYNVLEDPLFSDVIAECGQRVFGFAQHFGVTSKELHCSEGWLNVATTGQYQEFHIHPASHFSVVYYVATPPNCGNIVFRSHESFTDMFPLPTTGKQLANSKTHVFTPAEGEIVIFRSNLMHMVEKNKSADPRISIALNYVFR